MQIPINNTALSASSNISINSNKAQESLQRLASGTKLGNIGDDPALSSLSSALKSKISLQTQAISNITNGVAMSEIAQNALDEQLKIFDSIKQVLLDASNTAMHTEDELRAMYQDIVRKLNDINTIASQTSYNGVNLLQKDDTLATDTNTKGEASEILSFQAGDSANDVLQNNIQVGANTYLLDDLMLADTPQIVTSDYTFDSLINTNNMENFFSNKSGAATTYNPERWVTTVNEAIKKLSTYRQDMTNLSSNLQERFDSLNTSISHLKTANSSIESIDFAAESAEFNKYKILSQTGTFALAQANKLSEQILTLLR